MQQQSEAKEYASIIKHNSDLLLKLVNDAVSVTLLQTGQVPFTKEEVDICEICRTLVQDYATKAKPGVAVEVNLHQETFILNTDKKHIKQVLENLLSNAVKFTEKGCIILSTELAEDGNSIRFVVTDTGIGIPETIQNKMFDTFQKQDSFIQGVGLGLTICKLIAQSLNGSICLDTEFKKGTRMIFNHPII
jgi:signal transduction histidine kinase